MQSLSQIRDTLRTEGLTSALQQLNQRVPHRFTAVYQVKDEVMRNVAIVDKAGEVIPADLLAVPLTSSFCQFVLRDGTFKLNGNADGDARLDGHPYKGVVEAYVGVPLARGDGELIGTFCHFDFPAMGVSDEEYAFMQAVAKELPPYVAPPGKLSGEGAASVLPHLQAQLKR